MTHDILVLGGGPIGLELATEIATRSQSVTFVDGESMANRAREAGLTAHESTLETTPSVDCSAATVVVATPSDGRNLLLGAAAPRAFGADRVIALVNDPDRRAVFEDAGIETVCVSRAVAGATVGSLAVEDSSVVEDSTTPDRAAETDERVRLRD
jgi:Trk K+ transport system NAD-binding subunit